jgi:sugar lactone lactonase YvrE
MLFTATAEPSAEPPRVRLDLATENPMTTFSAITIRRDGVVIRALPPLGSDVSVVYDYDAPYDVACLYTVEADTVTVVPGFSETWPNVASWTGSGWSASAGTGTSSTDGATITRSVAGTLGSLQSLDVDWTTVQIRDSSDVVLVSIQVIGDHASILGSGPGVEPQTAVGSGPFSVLLADGTAYFTGAGYEAVNVPYDGTPTKVALVAAPGDPAKLLTVNIGAGFPPVDVAVTAGGDIWVVDYYNHDVYKYTSAGVYSGTSLSTVPGTAGSANGQFTNPNGIAIDSAGNIWIADSGNNRIQKFNSAGVYQTKFGTFGTGNGQFDQVGGMAIDTSDNVFVVDYGNNRIQKFNSSGTYQSKFGTFGTGNGQFSYPSAVARDSANNLYVTDTFNYRVQKFDSAGAYLSQWGAFGSADGQFKEPYGLAIDASDNVYVADLGNNRIQKFTSAGAFLYNWNGTQDGRRFKQTQSVGVDSAGNVYVADTNNYRVVKYDDAPQAAVVDDVTATLAPPGPVVAVGEDTETLTGLAMWLVHPTTPSLSMKVDVGAAGWRSPVVVNEETSRQLTSPASGRSVLEIEGSDLPVVVTTGSRRIGDRVLELEVVDFDTRDLVLAALKSNDPVLFRSPQSWDVDMPEGWFSVGDVGIERVRHPKVGQESVLSLPLTPVRTPIIETDFGVTWADVAVSGVTWADIADAGLSWLDLVTTGP